MSRDLDTIARQAAENLRSAVESAPLHTQVPVRAPARRRPSLRLVLVTAALLVSSAVAAALVADLEAPPPTTSPPAPTTTIAARIPPRDPFISLEIAMPTVSTTMPPTTTVPADITPPLLEITAPEDGAEFHEPEVVFSGGTEPGAVVSVGPHEANVEPDGSWSIALVLSKGKNQVEFTAVDEAGNKARAAVTVHYLVAETTTTTSQPAKEPAGFEAYASFGVCTLTPPYDVYYGKGKPGSTVFVQSDYGSGAVTVGEEGHWEIQVFFPEAPPNESFLVTVFDDLGREKAFEFIYQPEG